METTAIHPFPDINLEMRSCTVYNLKFFVYLRTVKKKDGIMFHRSYLLIDTKIEIILDYERMKVLDDQLYNFCLTQSLSYFFSQSQFLFKVTITYTKRVKNSLILIQQDVQS